MAHSGMPSSDFLSGLGRMQPYCDRFGFSRGRPIDRYYIESFLFEHRADIRGRVLEVGDSTYTRRFGQGRVWRADVLQYPPGDGHATFVGDLSDGAGLPDEAFDCVIFTQTLECIYNCRTALGHLFRALRSAGVLLLTVGCLTHISRYDMQRWGDFWRFTPQALRSMLSEFTSENSLLVRCFGNALAAVAFLYGLAGHELNPAELEQHDVRYPVTVAARAVKGGRLHMDAGKRQP